MSVPTSEVSQGLKETVEHLFNEYGPLGVYTYVQERYRQEQENVKRYD